MERAKLKVSSAARTAVGFRQSQGPAQIGVKISFKGVGVTALPDKAVNGGRLTPTILAMDAFETCFCRRMADPWVPVETRKPKPSACGLGGLLEIERLSPLTMLFFEEILMHIVV